MPLSPWVARDLDALVEAGHGLVLHLEVGLELLGHRPAHVDLHVLLHVRGAVEVQDPVDHLLGVLHLLDGLLADVGGELLVAPVLAHAGVDEVLVDRGELRAEHVLQDLDDLFVALHDSSLGGTGE